MSHIQIHSSIVDTCNFLSPWTALKASNTEGDVKHLSLSLHQQTSVHLQASRHRLNAHLHTCSELSRASFECHMKLLLSSMQLPAGVDLEAAQM